MIWYKNGQKTSEYWYHDSKEHRDDGPAKIFYSDGQKTTEYWYRDDGGRVEIWYENDQVIKEYWVRGYTFHRDDGPAMILYKNGQKIKECWYHNGEFGGNALAYVWLDNINRYGEIYVQGRKINTVDEFRDAVKGPLALQLMRPLPIPIRDAIFEHYCLQ